MQEKYELYFILSPELSTDAVEKNVETIKTLITSELGGKNLEVDSQGIKKLAYPIQKFKTGFYVLVEFETETKPATIAPVEKKLNINSDVMRYILVNQTEYYKTLDKESRNKVEITHHRELNKGKKERDRKDISNFMGVKAIDYKDYVFLNQFTSPYAKIFKKSRTGSTAKNQRKIKQAIKRARHMALMPFTTKHYE